MSMDLESLYPGVLTALVADSQLSPYVNASLPIPKVHRGTGPIRLMILGQDPTVKDEVSRDQITKVLNLKGYGALHNYIKRVCLDLGLDLDQNVYATNYVKNFFTAPPTQIKQADVLALAAKYWLPLLRDELAQYPSVPIITLGLPLLTHLVVQGASPQVRDYWDYRGDWPLHPPVNWRYLEPHQNILDRIVFPLPHQPSYRSKEFYHKYLPDYLMFVKRIMERESKSAG